MDCIFCKIVGGEIPSYKVYEDDKVLAFLDITPVNPGHTLVIPKKHYDNLVDMPDEEAKELLAAAKKIAVAVMAGTGAQGFNLNLNNGAVSGQLVGHVHFHIVPRFESDGRELWHGQAYADGEAQAVLEKIKSNL
jgi:histidine triad (HIT) family protein